jgi:NAD(P)-dependent dehydrogenase (short-subunit alcohol dehydrogenase family)
MLATGTSPTGATNEIFDLSGRRAVVTGASRGIGRALAIGLAQFGADVLCVARPASSLEETVARARAAGGGRVEHVATSLREPEAIAAVVEDAAKRLGGLDILVNNAADDHDSSVEQTSLEVFQRVIELNLQTCFLLCQAASPLLREGGGKVINVASVLSTIGVRDNSAYIAAKHGLLGLTRALALEWARAGIQVNAIAPGFIRTEMTAAVWGDEKASRWVERNTPVGRWGETDDLVGLGVLLASRASDFITGQLFVADGGWTVQ